MSAPGGSSGRVTDDRLPPGWPVAVRPPGSADWERTATAWLYDLCPPDYRAYPVLARRPEVLAWLAGRHVEASLEAARRALSQVRVRWPAGSAGSGPVEEVVEVLEQEVARLLGAGRAVTLVEAALRGERYVPRL